MYNIFVDYIRASDSVYRNKIIWYLAQDNVPAKLIRLIELTLINTRARVKTNNEYTEEFKVESGENQGDTLAATLFTVLVDVVLKQVDLRGNISTSLKQCSANADDILITAKQSLIDTCEKLKNQLMHFELTLNESKTKYLRCPQKNWSEWFPNIWNN